MEETLLKAALRWRLTGSGVQCVAIIGTWSQRWSCAGNWAWISQKRTSLGTSLVLEMGWWWVILSVLEMRYRWRNVSATKISRVRLLTTSLVFGVQMVRTRCGFKICFLFVLTLAECFLFSQCFPIWLWAFEIFFEPFAWIICLTRCCVALGKKTACQAQPIDTWMKSTYDTIPDVWWDSVQSY